VKFRTRCLLSLASIGNDMGQLSLAQAIKAGYGVTNVFADAWSAPPFMKVNNSVDNGGALCGVPGATCSSGDWRQAYANYLKQYAADYAAAGVPLTYIGPENEANFAPGNYDGMTLTPAQTASLLDVLGPARRPRGCPPRSGWTLKFTFTGDQHITNAWNGTATQSGENVTITNASYNGTIAPGGNTSLGFQGTWTNSDAVPTAFTVNGSNCTT
jgi:Cellulose binding domain/Glycosyl hydrolase family 30 TIM-barrel domain